MRTWTLALSICAHAAVVVAIFVAPIFATADLPDPHRPLIFETITPIVAPTVPVTRQPLPSQRSSTTQSIPMTPPTELPTVDAPPLEPLIGTCDDPCGVVGGIIDDGTTGRDVVSPPPPIPAQKDPVPVGGKIRPPTRVAYVAPVYPPLALAARKEGTVILQAVIDEKGGVREVKVLRGEPLLNEAALQAVTRWQFTPTLLNGTTVPVVMTVTVTFTLQK